MSVQALILAAGQGRRFGSDKRQALLPDGRSVLDAVLALHAGCFAQCWVVLRPGDAFGQAACARWGATPVWADDAEQGMGHSMACGVRAVLAQAATSAADGALQGLVLSLADMPFVQATTLRALQQAVVSQPDPVVPVHAGQMGHPRGLPVAHLPALSALQGDEGARHAIAWSAAHRLQVDDPGVLRDIDTPADLG
jgi:molybdenum cofactor cytidylyltransferase